MSRRTADRDSRMREAAQRSNARREAAAVAWGEGDAPTRQRTAMVIAAFLLDERNERELADWLLCARPEHAKAVATGVAAHALRIGIGAAAWDALAAVGAMDIEQASEWLEIEGEFGWAPEPEWLATEQGV